MKLLHDKVNTLPSSAILPAEWHPQSAIQLTWPHSDTDWAYMLPEVELCYIEVSREISKRSILLIVSPEVNHVKELLRKSDINLNNIRFFECKSNDTWARDHGAITMLDGNTPYILDFTFNGWGMKFASNFDNLITRELVRGGVLQGNYINRLSFVLEGGGIESDGKGTVLTTSNCLLSVNRNDEMSKADIDSYLKEQFNLRQILWLDHGYLAGDDTDSHVDTLARLCDENTIAYVKCTDVNDEHYEELYKMEQELKAFRTLNGLPYKLIALPMANSIVFEGERLPATYANFLIMDDAILFPTYNQKENDILASQALQEAFPSKQIIGIDCNALIKQHGSLHCITMQYPQGVIK